MNMMRTFLMVMIAGMLTIPAVSMAEAPLVGESSSSGPLIDGGLLKLGTRGITGALKLGYDAIAFPLGFMAGGVVKGYNALFGGDGGFLYNEKGNWTWDPLDTGWDGAAVAGYDVWGNDGARSPSNDINNINSDKAGGFTSGAEDIN